MNKGILIIFSLIFLVCCKSGTDKNSGARQAKGGVYYGGVFRVNEIEDFRNLFPLNITETTSAHIASQVYEGLVKISTKDLAVVPCLAESWDINDSATVFTFHIRKGVKFHDDACFKGEEGREVTAHDFKYSFDKLCEKDPNNQGFWIFKNRVAGADEYNRLSGDKKAPASGVSGIRVLDDYTLQIRLAYPFFGFMKILSTPFAYVFPKEAVDKYGNDMRVHCVGTGPFRVKDVKEGEAVILVRNDNYWGVDEHGNKLPYLDAVQFSFIKEKKSELIEFRKGNLDMVHQLPLEMIDEVIGKLEEAKSDYSKFTIHITPALAVQYYGFQHKGNIFNDKLVRQAFNYAVDRKKIVDYTLQGEGIPAFNGIVPPSFKEYRSTAVKGYEFNPEKARKLLAEAGYPNGKNFPAVTLQLNSGGSRNTQIAEVVQKMIKENLNVNVEFNVMPFAQHLENLESGKSEFWRAAWVADYPDPENFLNLLYSSHVPKNLHDKSYINSVRYTSSHFDSVFKAAIREVDPVRRNELYRRADQIAMDDAAILPIYYDEHTQLLQANVRNYFPNPMDFRDFSTVFISPEKPANKDVARK